MLAATLALTSCSKYFYAPLPPPTGFLTDSVKARISGGIATGDEHDVAYANVAARVQGNWMVLGSGSIVTHPKKGTTTADGGHIELGPGYSWKLDEKSTFETAALLGYGAVTLYDHQQNSSYQAQVKHFRMAVQPAICRVWKYGEVGFVSRFSWVQFGQPDASGMPPENDPDPYFLGNITEYKGRFCWEPSLVLRAGIKNLKLEAMTGLGYYAPGKGGMSNYYSSLGLVYIIRPMRR